MSDLILVDRADAVATVAFNRPKMRNAISLAMWTEIASIMADLSQDDAVRAVVLRGAGREAFASGADISEFTAIRNDIATAQAYNARTEAAYAAIRSCPKPTVAMIYGFCMGGAVAVAMACDLRFCSADAKFGIPAARLGILYGIESVRHLVALVGPAHAKDLLFSARSLDAAEALAIGFVNRLLPVAQLESYTYDYLKMVVANAPLSVRGAKAAVEVILDGGDARDQERLRRLSLEAFESVDYQEGTRAFLEKRPPRFEGR